MAVVSFLMGHPLFCMALGFWVVAQHAVRLIVAAKMIKAKRLFIVVKMIPTAKILINIELSKLSNEILIRDKRVCQKFDTPS